MVLFMKFFMEGSILAQDERWRRALHMQVERDQLVLAPVVRVANG